MDNTENPINVIDATDTAIVSKTNGTRFDGSGALDADPRSCTRSPMLDNQSMTNVTQKKPAATSGASSRLSGAKPNHIP